MTDRARPSWPAVIVGAVGFIALVVGITSVSGVLRTLAVIGVGFLAVALFVGVAVQRRIARKYPPVLFDPSDGFEVESKVEATRLRLADGESAAFAVHPVNTEFEDAEGQIWLTAAADGVLARIAVELALPDSVDDFNRHPAIASLLSAGWEIQSAQPREWVILTRSNLADATGVVLLAVEALAALFDISPESAWIFRQFA